MTADQEIRIWFDVTEFDFYVGDSDIWYEGDLDEDDFEIYYIPCLVSLGDADPLDEASCWTKRHTVRVNPGVVVAVGTVVTI